MSVPKLYFNRTLCVTQAVLCSHPHAVAVMSTNSLCESVLSDPAGVLRLNRKQLVAGCISDATEDVIFVDDDFDADDTMFMHDHLLATSSRSMTSFHRCVKKPIRGRRSSRLGRTKSPMVSSSICGTPSGLLSTTSLASLSSSPMFERVASLDDLTEAKRFNQSCGKRRFTDVANDYCNCRIWFFPR